MLCARPPKTTALTQTTSAGGGEGGTEDEEIETETKTVMLHHDTLFLEKVVTRRHKLLVTIGVDYKVVKTASGVVRRVEQGNKQGRNNNTDEEEKKDESVIYSGERAVLIKLWNFGYLVDDSDERPGCK